MKARWCFFLIPAIAALTIFLVFLTYYQGNIHEMIRFPALWIQAVSNNQGEGQSDIIGWLKASILANSTYAILMLCFISGAISVFYAYKQHSSRLYKAMAWICWIVFMGSFFVIVKRPSGSTLCEAGLVWITLSCAWVALLPQEKLRRNTAIIAIFVILPIFARLTIMSDFGLFANSHAAAEIQWELFNRTVRLAHGRPIVVALANNEYASYSVFELFQKGAADFPTWNISAIGEQLIGRHVSGIKFTNEYTGTMSNIPITKDTVAVWFDRQDRTPIATRVPQLASVLNATNYSCSQQQLNALISVHVCAPRGEPS